MNKHNHYQLTHRVSVIIAGVVGTIAFGLGLLFTISLVGLRSQNSQTSMVCKHEDVILKTECANTKLQLDRIYDMQHVTLSIFSYTIFIACLLFLLNNKPHSNQ